MDDISISRRQVIGAGITAGLAIAIGQTSSVMAKAPSNRNMSSEIDSAYVFAVNQSFRCSTGYWAVIYTGDAFTGKPTLIGEPQLRPKPQTGILPLGWGAESGSLVVGAAAVLRLIHKVNGQDTHITLLPSESVSKVGALKMADGQLSWKLYPAGNLRPPY